MSLFKAFKMKKMDRLVVMVVLISILTVGCTSKAASAPTADQAAPKSETVKSTAASTPTAPKVPVAETKSVENPVETYDAYIRTLNVDEVNTISAALTKYKELAASKTEENDQMLESFIRHYNKTIEALNGKDPESIEKLDKKILKENGLRLNASEAGSFVGDLPSYLLNNFENSASPAKKEWLKIRTEEALQLGTEDSGTYLIEDAGLSISWDQLSDRIIRWEKYLQAYPDSRDKKDVTDTIASYLWLYMASPLDNTPIFTNNQLNADVKKSYERFISKYPDSKYEKLIAGYYNNLKTSNFKLNQKAIDYLKKYKFDTETLQKWLDLKW